MIDQLLWSLSNEVGLPLRTALMMASSISWFCSSSSCRKIVNWKDRKTGNKSKVWLFPQLIHLQYFHSFIPAISIAPLQVLYYSEALPTTARIPYRSFTPKRTGNGTGKGLAQGPYVAARAWVEPTTLRLKVIVSTKAPPRPTFLSNGLNWISLSSWWRHNIRAQRLK